MASGFRADAAIVGEPTDLALVHAHKGAVRWKITTRGVAAHSSNPALGVSAISKMQKVLGLFEGPLAVESRRRRHPLLGSPTVSVGTIRGGTQVNIIPPSCTIEAEWRMIPGEDAAAVTARLRRCLEALRKKDRDFAFRLEEIERYHPFEEDMKSPVARLAAGACRRALGKVSCAVAPWAANSGAFKHAGIPTILFGPGSIKQAHTKDEFINLNQVVAAANVYAEIKQFHETHPEEGP
jgi:acetylornithine deacetylase